MNSETNILELIEINMFDILEYIIVCNPLQRGLETFLTL